MKYLLRIIVMVIIIICSIPILLFSIIAALWLWDFKVLEIYSDSIFCNEALNKHITDKWDL